MKLFVYILLTFSISLQAKDTAKMPWELPWGTDADIAIQGAYSKPEKPLQKSPSLELIEKAARKIILFHQNYLSTVDAPRSHFRPSSSQYMLDAIENYGFFQGFILGCDRLMRENDEKWIYPPYQNGSLKYDPVP